MKKLVEINSVCNGSTGNIMCNIAKEANKLDFESYCFFGRGNPNNEVNCKKFGNKLSFYFHAFLARLGFNGYGSYFSTKRMIKELKKINPDIIHLHNIHGYYLNFKVLFKYLKKEYKGKLIWTLHDCWSFTGHCSYFTMAKCSKWKKQCYNCPQLNIYPKTIFDTTKNEFKLKKKLFLGLNNMTLVTPSNWLKELVEKSFLKEYEIKVINNGIDLNIFKPTYDESIYEKYNIPKNKKILLGVANIWEKRKGLNIFIDMSKKIKDDTIIVLVGLNKTQILSLPDNIIGIERTDNVNDLVKIYSASDIFINPSLEETFSLVTVEAMSCGLPVVVSKTSAIKELVTNGIGNVVDKEIASDYLNKITDLFFDKRKLKNYVKKYSLDKNINSYISLYNE